MPELLALARRKPDLLTYASSGNGSVNHLLGEMLKLDAGIRMLHIPYKGIAPAGIDMRIVRKINADVAAILRTRDMQEFFRAQGAEALISTPEELHRMLVSDAEKWAKVVKASGARID